MIRATPSHPQLTVDVAIELLRQLSPHERLKVIATILPEMEGDLPTPSAQRNSLRGLWKDLQVHVTAQDIDQARQEMWANFPREDF